jgi:splicing factor U2AF subunit
LEFRTVKQLHVARPESYQRAVSEAKQQFIPGGVSTNVVDSPFKVFMGSIPTSLSDEQVMELLKAFGDLKSFNLIKDLQTGEPKVCLFLICRDLPFSNF